jgi:hypothetical protein
MAFRKLLKVGPQVSVVRLGPAFVMDVEEVTQEVDVARLTDVIASVKLKDGIPLFIGVQNVDQNIRFRLNKKVLDSASLREEIVFFPGAGRVALSDLFSKKVMVDTGIHLAGRGIFCAYGRKLQRNVHIKKVEIFDITPTLLTLLNLPIAKDMDGDLDRRWFSPELASSLEPQYISTYATEEEKQERIPAAYTEQEVGDLEERLKMLGYL